VIDTELDREEVYQLVLPSTSVFGDGEKGKLPLRAYAKHLKNNGVPITGVVTEMRFDTASPTPKLVFRALRGVTEHEYETIVRLADSSEANKAITMSVHETDNVTKEAPAEKPAPKAEPKAHVEKVVAEEVEEPKKQESKKAAPTESKLEDLVGEWDD
jgi:outer membrane biosynthesis protein TonB